MPGPTNLTQSLKSRTSGFTTTSTVRQTTTDSFTINGMNNQVRPRDLDRALNASETGASNAAELGANVIDRSPFGVTLEPGAKYQLDASGTVDQMNNWFGGNVGPGSTDDNGRTALQLFVSNQDGEVVDRLNYRPGMEIDASRYPDGARLHGVMAEDGNRYNNTGDFKLNVTRIENKTIDENRATRDELEQIRAGAIDRERPAGSIPAPRADLSRMPVDRALAVDREHGAIVTHGGYEIQPGDNSVTVLTPGAKEGTTFNFKDGRWTESDGTQAKIDDIVKDGNFVFGDGTTMAFRTNDDGTVTGLTVASDRARVDVSGLQNSRPHISGVKDDGLEWRVQRFENTERTNFYQAGIGDRAEGTVDSDKITGWYGTYKGEQLGWVEGVWDNGKYRNRVDDDVPAVVDQSLRPPLGTDSYERALNNIFYEELGTTSGTIRDRARTMGYNVDPTRAREAALDYLQPRLRQIGEANLLNRMERDYPGLYMEQMYGGTPQYYPSMQQSYQALAQLQTLLQMQAMWSTMGPPPMIYG